MGKIWDHPDHAGGLANTLGLFELGLIANLSCFDQDFNLIPKTSVCATCLEIKTQTCWYQCSLTMEVLTRDAVAKVANWIVGLALLITSVHEQPN